MAQSFPVELPIGVRHVDAFFEVSTGEPLRDVGFAPHLDRVVCRLVPHVDATAAPALERVAGEIVERHDAEWRNDVFGEVLVLIVTEHHDEVRVERFDLGAELPERFHQPPPVLAMRRDAFVLAPLGAHAVRPVERVLQLRRHSGIIGERSQEGPRLGLVRLDHCGPV